MPPTAKPTIYFGYGSNLWLHQMSIRCPQSPYIGIARLPSYRWIINDRGYANVVEIKSPSSPTCTDSDFKNEVWGLVYSLTATDESRLDKNEGVPHAYTKESLSCEFWASKDGKPVDTSKPCTYEREMLVYIDRKRTTDDEPKKEYVYRMNKGIDDAVRMGVPEGYVRDVMRKFIPEPVPEEKEEKGKGVEGLAMKQAEEFMDENVPGAWTQAG